MAARVLLLLVLCLGQVGSTLAQDLVWESPPGNAVRYEVRIEDKSRSKAKKFAGERAVEFTLVLRFAQRQDDVVPILCTVERYAVAEKDQEGFSMAFDTTKKPDEETGSLHKTALELCERLYPIGMESNVSLVRFREFSTDTMESRSVAEQFSDDLRLALTQVLPPLDGGSKRKPHSWTVSEEWSELRTAVPLKIEHRLTSIKEDNPELARLGGGIATIKFRGSGQAKQGDDAVAYTARVAMDGEYQFACGRHFDGRTLQSFKSTETLTTDDAFGSARTRTVSIQAASAKLGSAFSQRERTFLTGAKTRTYIPFHPRSLAAARNK